MSQVVRIIGARVTGMVFLGPVTDPDTGEATDTWSSDPERVVSWLWDGYRGRFNQRRSLRSKRVYQPDPSGAVVEKGKHAGKPKMVPVVDDDGVPVLVPVGGVPGVDELKSQFRLSHPFAAAIPDLMLQHADRSENTEWFAAAKRRKISRGSMPFFRSRKREHVRFAIFTGGPKCSSPQARFVRTGKRSGLVTITGRNPQGKAAPGHGRAWSVAFRVRFSQPIRPYTSVEIDWTTKRLVFVSPVPVREHEFTGAVVGLDVGVAHTITTSDGVFLDQPNTDMLDAQIKQHQRSLARKKKLAGYANGRGYTPSKRYIAEREKLAHAHTTKARRLDDWRHKTTTQLVRDYDLIGYEALNVKGMTASAKGTAEKPGKNVKQKAGLNRSLADSAFATLRSMIEYKAIAAGVLAIPVPPANTSRECNTCHHTAKENRESQAVFSCTQCGHTAHADVNAASNILDRALDRLPQPHLVGGAGHAPAGDIRDKTESHLRVVRPLGGGGKSEPANLPRDEAA